MDTKRTPSVPTWLTIVLIVLAILTVSWLNYGNYLGGAPLWALIVNTFLIAIPTGMLYFSIWVLALAFRQRKEQGTISGRPARFIYWTPRIAGIVIAVFVSLFSFDVFEGDAPIWEKLIGFLIHSLPAIILGIVAALAWRRDWIGVVFFGAAALFFLSFVLRDPIQQLGVVLLFSAPLALIALMYWANWKWHSPGDPGSAINPTHT